MRVGARNEAGAVAPTLMIIGGDARESANATFIDGENPANRTIVGRVPRAADADVDAALQIRARRPATQRSRIGQDSPLAGRQRIC